VVGTIVIDTSISMAWCFDDEQSTYADAVLGALSQHSAIVPALWPYEVANAIVIAERRKRISAAERDEALAFILSLPIEIEHSPAMVPAALIRLSNQFELTAYDAAYLELARQRGLPLATIDAGLARAAAAAGVAAFLAT
jgi:predicted nucleic acid-binding protein